MLLAQAGFEDSHVGTLDTVVGLTEAYLLKLGRLFRHILDEPDPPAGGVDAVGAQPHHHSIRFYFLP
jgi:hypothetical protein